MIALTPHHFSAMRTLARPLDGSSSLAFCILDALKCSEIYDFALKGKNAARGMHSAGNHRTYRESLMCRGVLLADTHQHISRISRGRRRKEAPMSEVQQELKTIGIIPLRFMPPRFF
jgi:hypothetical protein